MKLKLTLLLLPLLLLTLLIGGCNIFGWTSGEDAESLIEEGKDYMREADYAAAVESFKQAMEEDPYSSDARYYHAKATVHASGFNALHLADILSDTTFAAGDNLPFTDPVTWPVERANSLYQTMAIVHDDLAPIIQHQTTGGFDSSDIILDYGFAEAFSAILGFQDTDIDNDIDNNDFRFSITYGDSSAYQITNLVDYFQQLQAPKITVGKVATPVVIDQVYIDQFNALVDNIDELIDNALAIIEDLFEDIDEDDDAGWDLDEIIDSLEEIRVVAHMYRVADGIDNDGDGSNNEEVVDGLDNDGDGIIDEDSNGTYDLNP